MDRLEAPREVAVVDVERDDRVRPVVAPRAAPIPRDRVAGHEVEQPGDDVDARVDPDRPAAALPLVDAPRARAELAWARRDVPAPELGARLRVEREGEGATAPVAAGGALDHHAVVVHRCRGELDAVGRVADLL